MLVLGVDTCGPTGSVALATVERGHGAGFLRQTELAGRSYSATLVAAVGELLAEQAVRLGEIGGSGGGERAGKLYGRAGGAQRGEGTGGARADSGGCGVAAGGAGGEGGQVSSAALDAHRHEVFLRLEELDASVREMLAGAEELATVALRPQAGCGLR